MDNDTISRQAAIDLINDIDLINFTAKGIVRDRLRKLPSAQPDRKNGKWIDGYKRQTCSVCKQKGFRSWNFCPNCGADMRGERMEGKCDYEKALDQCVLSICRGGIKLMPTIVEAEGEEQ
jgi:hypothetical protein